MRYASVIIFSIILIVMVFCLYKIHTNETKCERLNGVFIEDFCVKKESVINLE